MHMFKVVSVHWCNNKVFTCISVLLLSQSVYFTCFQETQKLQKKQAWYQQNQVSMTKDDEESYLEYCSQAMFRIHILELRLNR